jgi:hypothetical protein
MNKPFLTVTLLLIAVIITPMQVFAGDIADADALYDNGGMQDVLNSIDRYERFLATNPEDFEANWKCARACRQYGEAAKKSRVDDWKTLCAAYGKKGMIYGAKARELNPDDPAGYYYFGLSVGTYSDGTSILTALKEGLKDKTQTNFEKVYELDKRYDDAGSILALGRFWAVLPWPLTNKKKALAYYREFQQTDYFQSSVEGWIYLSELLITLGGDNNIAEARALLNQAMSSNEPYFTDWAQRLLNKID